MVLGWDDFGTDDTPIRALAREFGMRYAGSPTDRQFLEDSPEGVPTELSLFRQTGGDAVTDLVHGTFGGLPAMAFVYDAVTYAEDPGSEKRACVAFRLDAQFPTLSLGPHTRLSRVQERSKDPFLTHFRISTHDPDAPQVLLDEGLRSWLLGIDLSLRIEIGGSALLGHVSASEPDAFALLFPAVYGVQLRIPDAAWARWGLNQAAS